MRHRLLLDPQHALPEGCISGLVLEQLFCGELDLLRPADVSGLRAHLSACASCQERYAALEQARSVFESHFSMPALEADLGRRLALAEQQHPQDLKGLESTSFIQRVRAWWQQLWPGFSSTPVWGGALAVAVLGLILLPRAFQSPEGYLGEKSALRAPGALEVYVLRSGDVRPAQEGESFQAGDRLQFLVRPGSYRFLHLVSLDSTGHLSAFFPEEGQESMPLGADGEQLLPEAIELDGFQGTERIFALFTEAPIPWRRVREASELAVHSAGGPARLDLLRLKELPLADAAQVSFLMVKP